MNTQTLHLNQGEQHSAKLQNLASIRRQRVMRINQLREKRLNTPLTVHVAEVTKPREPERKPVFAVSTLQHFDTLFVTVGRLSESQPQDAQLIASALLSSLLRLSWARLSGRPKSSPAAADIPLKLFQRHAMTKKAMKRLSAAIGEGASISAVLECSRALLIWLASDPEAVIQ